MVEILATYDAERPEVQRLASGQIRVIIHFGHTTVDIIDTCRGVLSIDELEELVDLWANPERKRNYTDLPIGLLVSRSE